MPESIQACVVGPRVLGSGLSCPSKTTVRSVPILVGSGFTVWAEGFGFRVQGWIYTYLRCLDSWSSSGLSLESFASLLMLDSLTYSLLAQTEP